METFNSLGLLPAFTEKLKERSITAPTGIQRLVIPLLLAGKSVIFRSATGTGKTFAYLLPALQRLLSDTESVDKNPRYPGPALLICAPTLELCSQIKAEADLLSPFPAALLIGSVKIDRQIETLKKNKPLTAVGNPGRLLLLAKMGKLKFQNLRFLVLDEADRLTSEEILGQTREMLSLIERDTRRLNVKDDGEFSGGLCIAACSATVTGKTGVLLGPLFDSAEIIESDEHEILRERIEHWALFSESRKKVQTLRSLLAALKTAKPRFKALVFTSRNEEAGKILSALQFHHIPATGLFGKMDRGGAKKQISRKPASRDRKAALDLFRQGSINVLVSTDLAARGLDISGLTHIIAMDVSADREIYIHRAGRTGRAGRRGVMISIGDEFELRRLASLEKQLAIMVRPRELYMGRICDPTE